MSDLSKAIGAAVKAYTDEALSSERIEKIARKIVKEELKAALSVDGVAPSASASGTPRVTLSDEEKKARACEHQNKFRARRALVEKYGVGEAEAKTLIAGIDSKFSPPERVRLALRQLGRIDADGNVTGQGAGAIVVSTAPAGDEPATIDTTAAAPLTVVPSLDGMDMQPTA